MHITILGAKDSSQIKSLPREHTLELDWLWYCGIGSLFLSLPVMTCAAEVVLALVNALRWTDKIFVFHKETLFILASGSKLRWSCHREFGAVCGNSFGCYNWCITHISKCCKHLTMHRTASRTKNYPVQNVSNASAEKPCLGLKGPRGLGSLLEEEHKPHSPTASPNSDHIDLPSSSFL